MEKIKEKVSDILLSDTDPDGWYTGVTSAEQSDEPVQDADDL